MYMQCLITPPIQRCYVVLINAYVFMLFIDGHILMVTTASYNCDGVTYSFTAPVDVFFPPGKVKMFVYIARNVKFL